MEFNSEKKLEEQNNSRLTDSKGLVVTKGEGGCGGREKWIEGYYDWYTWCWRHHGEDSIPQRRQVVTLWHLTTVMDGDFSGVWGDLIIGVNIVTTMFFM